MQQTKLDEIEMNENDPMPQETADRLVDMALLIATTEAAAAARVQVVCPYLVVVGAGGMSISGNWCGSRASHTY
jgi:hypothetical protein